MEGRLRYDALDPDARGDARGRRFDDALGVLAHVQDLSGDRCQAMWHLMGKCHKELGHGQDERG